MHAWEKLDKGESLRKNAVKLVVRQTNINDEGKKYRFLHSNCFSCIFEFLLHFKQTLKMAIDDNALMV